MLNPLNLSLKPKSDNQNHDFVALLSSSVIIKMSKLSVIKENIQEIIQEDYLEIF